MIVRNNRMPGCMNILRLPLIAAMVLAFSLMSAVGAAADSGSATYQYLLGVSPIEGPDVAMASDGSTVTITGQGMLSVHPNSVSGGGDFTIMDSAGNVTASGTWTATSLSSFVSYGCGTLFGNPVPPNYCGGQAMIQVQLSSGQTATLMVYCLVGTPPAGKEEGVRLAIDNGVNFNKQAGGQTLFILQ
jgi:hypothetical protein